MVTNVDKQLHRYLKKISARNKICKSNRSKHYWITDDSGSVVLHIRFSDHISGRMLKEKNHEKIDIIKVEKNNVYVVMGFGIQVNLWEDEVIKFVKHLIGSRVMVSKQFSELVSAARKYAAHEDEFNLKLTKIQKDLKEIQEDLNVSREAYKVLTKKNNVLKENHTALNNKHVKTVNRVKDLRAENEKLNQTVSDLTKELESVKSLLSNIYSSVNPIMEEIKIINN